MLENTAIFFNKRVALGVLELRFTANASRKDFKKGFHDLINYGLPPSSQEEEDLAMTIRNLPRFNRGDCRLRFDNYRYFCHVFKGVIYIIILIDNELKKVV